MQVDIAELLTQREQKRNFIYRCLLFDCMKTVSWKVLFNNTVAIFELGIWHVRQTQRTD